MRISKADARKNFSEVMNRAGSGKERVKVTHYGRTLAVVISKADLAALERCEGARAKDAAPVTAAGARAKRARRR